MTFASNKNPTLVDYVRKLSLYTHANALIESYLGLIGVIINFVVFSGYSSNLYAVAYPKERAQYRKPINERLPYTGYSRWWIGLVMVVLGAIGDFVSFGLAPYTLVAPAGSFTLVANVFFAYFFLGYTLLWYDYAGTVLVIAGAVVAVVFGSHVETSFTIYELIRLWARLEMIVYATLVLLLLISLYLFISRAEAILARSLIEALEEHASAAQAAALQAETQGEIDEADESDSSDSERETTPRERESLAVESGGVSGNLPGNETGSAPGHSEGNPRGGSQAPASDAVQATGSDLIGALSRSAPPQASAPAGREDPKEEGVASRAGRVRRQRYQKQRAQKTSKGGAGGLQRSNTPPPSSSPGLGILSPSSGRAVTLATVPRTGSTGTLRATDPRFQGTATSGRPPVPPPQGTTEGNSAGTTDGSASDSDGSSDGSEFNVHGAPSSAALSKSSRSSRASRASSAAEQLDRMRHASATDVVAEALDSPPEDYLYYSRMHPIFYGTMSGTIGGQSVLFAKAVSELLKVTFSGDNYFRFVLTYVQIVALVACILLQQHFLAKGLQLFDTLLIVPVFSSTFMFASIIAGGVYYREFDAFDTVSWICFPIGISLVLGGVYILSGRQKQAQQAHEQRLKELYEADRGDIAKAGSKTGSDDGPGHWSNAATGEEDQDSKEGRSAVVSFSPSPVHSPAGKRGESGTYDAGSRRRLTADIEMTSVNPAALETSSKGGAPDEAGEDGATTGRGGGGTGVVSMRDLAGDAGGAGLSLGGQARGDTGFTAMGGGLVASERLHRPRGHTVSGGLHEPGGGHAVSQRHARYVDDSRRGSLLRAGWSHRFGSDYGMGSVVGQVPGIGRYFGGGNLDRHAGTLDALMQRRLQYRQRNQLSFGRRRTVTAGGVPTGGTGEQHFSSVQVVPARVAEGLRGDTTGEQAAQLERSGLGRVVSAPVEGLHGPGPASSDAAGTNGPQYMEGDRSQGIVADTGMQLPPVGAGRDGRIGTMAAQEWAGGRRSTVGSGVGVGSRERYRYRSGSVLDAFVDVYNSLTVAANASAAVQDAPSDSLGGAPAGTGHMPTVSEQTRVSTAFESSPRELEEADDAAIEYLAADATPSVQQED